MNNNDNKNDLEKHEITFIDSTAQMKLIDQILKKNHFPFPSFDYCVLEWNDNDSLSCTENFLLTREAAEKLMKKIHAAGKRYTAIFPDDSEI